MDGENHEKFLERVVPAVPPVTSHDAYDTPHYDSREVDAKIVCLERAVKNLTAILLVIATVGASVPICEVLLEMIDKGIDFEDDLKFDVM